MKWYLNIALGVNLPLELINTQMANLNTYKVFQSTLIEEIKYEGQFLFVRTLLKVLKLFLAKPIFEHLNSSHPFPAA